MLIAIKYIRLLFLFSIISILNLIPFIALAGGKFKLLVTNNLNVPLYFYNSGTNQINELNWKAPDRIVYPGQTNIEVANWKDKGGAIATREIKFHAQAMLDDSLMLDENSYDMRFYWKHKLDGSWQTKIQTYDSDDYNVPYSISEAKCSNHANSYDSAKSCLNNYTKQQADGDRESVWVTFNQRPLAHGFYRFNTINLGKVTVTTAYGKPVKYDYISNAVNLSDANEKFDVHFSKTQRFCKVREGELICPTSIAYYFSSNNPNSETAPDEQFVFACRQVETGDTVCPWTTQHNEIRTIL